MKQEKLDEAKRLYKTASSDQRYVLERLFPELKESEDERIRKEIIKLVKFYYGSSLALKHTVSKDEMVAWLERQGKEEYSLKSSKDEDVRKFMQCIEKQAKAYEINLPNRSYDMYTFAKYLLVWLEKQGEKPQGKSALEAIKEEKVDNQNCVKPANKVEPKFKVRDWVVFNGLTLYVKEVVKGFYRTISIDGIPNSYDWNIDNAARLWTIQDAKPGDVLATDAGGVFIYAKVLYNMPYAYCGVDKFGVFKDNCLNNNWTNSVDCVHPATKEQRQQLEKAMTDARYTFDFDKKELNRIMDEKQIKKNLQDNSFRRMFEQNPAWSEEDETKIKSIIAFLKSPALCAMDGNKGIIDENIKYLKSLKDRVQSQSKQEWDEEDCIYIETIACHLDNIGNGTMAESLLNIMDKYKSLRTQNTWKPSEEQMEALEHFIVYHNGSTNYAKDLEELRLQLKKL